MNMENEREDKINIDKHAFDVVLDDISNQLDIIRELKNSGKEESIKAAQSLLEQLDSNKMQGNENEVNAIRKQCRFPEAGELVAEGERIYLCVLDSDEREKYLSVIYDGSCFMYGYNNDTIRQWMWESAWKDKILLCSIYEKNSKDYLGYCFVKNLDETKLELGIDLKQTACGMGFGSEALSLLMKSFHKLIGAKTFYARVLIENTASQNMVKKLGGIPSGIREYILHGEDLEKFREENKDRITEEIRRVAMEFGVNPVELLGCVLEYRFFINN